MKYKFLIVLCILLFSSCKENKKDYISHLVAEWQGKEIKFPDNLTFTRFIDDTVNYQISETNYKIVMYVDSIGCVSCKLQLKEWAKFISFVDSVTSQSIPFLFFFQPLNNRHRFFYFINATEINDSNKMDLNAQKIANAIKSAEK